MIGEKLSPDGGINIDMSSRMHKEGEGGEGECLSRMLCDLKERQNRFSPTEMTKATDNRVHRIRG